jgi:hypothetical protein
VGIKIGIFGAKDKKKIRPRIRGQSPELPKELVVAGAKLLFWISS